MDLVYLFRILAKRKWIILAAALFAAGVAFYFTRNQPKYYRSNARISTGFTITDQIKVNDQGNDVYEADSKFNNAVVTMTSPSVTSLVSYMLVLHDLQDSSAPFRRLSTEQKQSALYKQVTKQHAIDVFSRKLETISTLTSFKPEEKELLEYLDLYGYGAKSIAGGMNVYRLERTDYMQIDYVSENPELSAFVVNNVFQQFLRYYKSIRSDISQEAIDTLRSLVDKKKQDYDDKKKALQDIGISDVGQESGSNLDQISNLEQTLTDNQSQLVTLNSNLRKVNQKLADLGDVSAVKRPENNNDELLILRNEKNEAYRDWVNSGSTDKALYDKYDHLNTEYQKKMLDNNHSSTSPSGSDNGRQNTKANLLSEKSDIEIDIQGKNTDIKTIEGKIGGLKGQVIHNASKGALVDGLLKDMEMASKDYIAAKEKYNNANDITNTSINNFRQIIYGQPAIGPEPSKRKFIVGMAGMAALLTTMLIIILLAYLDTTVKTPVLFSRMVNLKLLSMVNFTNLQNKNLAEILAKKGTNKGKDTKRYNVFRESIRKLRYEIENTGKKIFLFTSTKKGMGKTTLIQALSYSFSFSKKKILIIDTNFCNNDLTVLLHASPILDTIVPGKNADSQSIIGQVKRASTEIVPGLIYIVGSESGDFTPSEVLPPENILQHLHTLAKEFDYIFLEGPPLNDFSDSKELVQYVDGVIAVFSAHHNIKVIDKESIKFYNELNGKFSGAILNMIDLENINVT